MTITGESLRKGCTGRNGTSLGAPELLLPRDLRSLRKMHAATPKMNRASPHITCWFDLHDNLQSMWQAFFWLVGSGLKLSPYYHLYQGHFFKIPKSHVTLQISRICTWVYTGREMAGDRPLAHVSDVRPWLLSIRQALRPVHEPSWCRPVCKRSP